MWSWSRGLTLRAICRRSRSLRAGIGPSSSLEDDSEEDVHEEEDEEEEEEEEEDTEDKELEAALFPARTALLLIFAWPIS